MKFFRSLPWWLSLFLVAFAQPAWFSVCGPLAAAGGYALFWREGLKRSSGAKAWVGEGFFWFAGVQAIQWSWFANDTFQGVYIYVVYILLVTLWAAQFAGLSWFIWKSQKLTLGATLGLAGSWTLLELSRLFLFTGSTFNPVGLALTASHVSLQFASLLGIYGLSFWVIWTNLLALRAWQQRGLSSSLLFGVVALVPYLYGLGQLFWVEKHREKESLEVALVQTAKVPFPFLPQEEKQELFSHLLRRWQEVLGDLKEVAVGEVDLIVFPECALPYGCDYGAYLYRDVKGVVELLFGERGVEALPDLERYGRREVLSEEGSFWLVSNGYWARWVANYWEAEVIIGLEHQEKKGEKVESYNSAFHFLPGEEKRERYDKQQLLPMGEYIPFSFLSSLAAQYGIHDSFQRGDQVKVLSSGKVPLSVTVCYEETFPNLVRQSRQKGSQLLVNVTSDVWFPHSKLPTQHYTHGLVRAVETGLPLVRACNTGVSAVVDALGREVAFFGEGNQAHEWKHGVLVSSVPLFTYPTGFLLWGNEGIAWVCVLLCGGALFERKGRRAGESEENGRVAK